MHRPDIDGAPFQLTYFDTHGRALQIRLLFCVTGTAFTDRRISRQQWSQLKTVSPWGHLPLLEHGEVTVWNTTAIVRYVAGRVGMWPDAELDEVRTIALLNSVDDVWGMLSRFAAVRNPIRFAWMARGLMKTELPSICDRFQSVLTGNFVLGDRMSAVDVSVFSLFSVILDRAGKLGARRIVGERRRLRAFIDRMGATPEIAAHLASNLDQPVR